MRPALPLLLCALVLLVPLVVAHGGSDHEDIAERTVEVTGPLAPGEFVEADLEMEGDDRLMFDIKSDIRFRWDLHRHTASGTEQLMNGTDVDSVSETFTAPEDDFFSIFVVGTGQQEGEVEITLDGRFALVDLIGLEEAGDAPAPPIVLLLAAAGLVLFAARRA